MHEADIAIIGGGIAGASAAYELAATSSVILLERESHCGYHSTGRSAASFTENYGNALIRRLAIASRSFLEAPPDGFCDHPLMHPRGMLTIAREEQLEPACGRARTSPRIGAVDPSRDARGCAGARAGAAIRLCRRRDRRAGLRASSTSTSFTRVFCAARASVAPESSPMRASMRSDGTRIAGRSQTSLGTFAAPVVVNAAGAWADTIAGLAGVAPIGLVPKRRTAFHVAAPDGVTIAGWPLVNDVGDEFYFKPDAGRIFVSPSDATPSEPMDAYPDELDVAIGVDRLQRATTIEVRRIEHQWAGLRSFVGDGSPVVGFDDDAEGFFWLAGQGGYGIKTSPALARACRELILTGRLPDDLLRQGIEPGDLAPGRIRMTSALGQKEHG